MIRSGQLLDPLKCPKTVGFRPVLILKLASCNPGFDGLGMLREFLSQHELRCATTSKLVDQLIGQLVQDGFCEVFLVVNALFNHIFPVIIASNAINHQFNDMLDQQSIALKKLHMHINPKYFD